jgi:AGCS family alanine or glycine:cation symporter
MYETVVGGIETFSDFLWGGNWGDQSILPVGPITILLLGTGLYLMVGLRFMPIRQLPRAFRSLFDGKHDKDDGAISPFQALATALSGQIGTGNLAGVATAITLGGPAAIFWMWVTAMVGMASAYSESMLAVRYREHPKDGKSSVAGGPMYYIRNGLGKHWTWLAVLFAVGTLFSAVATGNMIQANSLTNGVVGALGNAEILDPDSLQSKMIVGAAIAVMAFVVIIGGIKSIGSVAGRVVPLMAITYVIVAVGTLAMNVAEIPAAFGLIFNGLFEPTAAAGGFLGATMAAGVRFGVERGLFSNEAGQGSAPIAHAAARTKDPVQQGKIAMVGTFLDTMIICTMTALVILTVTGDFVYNEQGETIGYAWLAGLEGIQVTQAAYNVALPYGDWYIAIILAFFAFTTILGWSYYGERAIAFLGGEKMVLPFRIVWVVMVFVGSFQQVDVIWRLGGIANAAMAAPNLIALVLLSGMVFKITREHDAKIKAGALDVDYDASAHVDDDKAADDEPSKD